MGNFPSSLLTRILVFQAVSSAFTETDWERLLLQARAAGVLSRLAYFRNTYAWFMAPVYLQPHLDSAYKFWLSQKRLVEWELAQLGAVFRQLQLPLVLLKGTAYSAAGLNAGGGRIFSDIDILVPKSRLLEVKASLKWAGWIPKQLDNYDVHYYERWMHELPPMQHIQRGTMLDVHHNILPETCALCPDAEQLLQGAVQIPGREYWRLAAEDMVLHSASHLFWGGEFDNALRDLSDIDCLLREFSFQDDAFWQKLLDRAGLLGLGKPLFYALRYTSALLGTPVPARIIAGTAVYGRSAAANRFMDFLFFRAFLPIHPSCNDGMTTLARNLLFMRSHYLRMPLHLLVPHLVRKAWLRLVKGDSER